MVGPFVIVEICYAVARILIAFGAELQPTIPGTRLEIAVDTPILDHICLAAFAALLRTCTAVYATERIQSSLHSRPRPLIIIPKDGPW